LKGVWRGQGEKKRGGNADGKGSEGVSITGNRKDNVLIGTEFDDSILVRQGDDTLIGLGGNDFLFAEEGGYILDGGSGDDRLFGMRGADTLNGGDGNYEFFGGLENDSLTGDVGDDVLLGGLGSDFIDGGTGYDTAEFTDIGGDISLSSDPQVFTVDGITLTASGTIEGSYLSQNEISPGIFETDTLVNISRIIGANFNGSMTGGSFDDNFAGAMGDDTLSGGAGDDTLYGGLDSHKHEAGEEGGHLHLPAHGRWHGDAKPARSGRYQ
jgi:Ca2+-binding RTX toxin-like protein